MEPYSAIENFLRRVKQIRAGDLSLKGIYWLLAVAGAVYLAGNLLAYFNVPHLQTLKLPLALLFVAVLGYTIYRHLFKQGPYAPFTLDDAALLTESRHPELNNSLINASQLLRQLSDPGRESQVSFSLIQEQLRRTQKQIENINPASVVDDSDSVRSRYLFLGSAAALLLAVMVLPNFLSRGYQNWIAPPASEPAAALAVAEKPQETAPAKAVRSTIEDLKLTYHFPAYTGKSSKVIDPSDGSVFVLPGTEVRVEAKAVPAVPAAELVLNGKDGFSMQVLDAGRLQAQILVKEPGFYQFKVKDADGARHLLAKKYEINLEKDNPPSVTLFIANPKPVYYANSKVELFYEIQDDYGIREIELVAVINGNALSIPVKRLKEGETMVKGSYSWNLGGIDFGPGDEVQYYLESKDNDNVLGPNIGQSETFSFTIFDSRKEREDLILLQEELTEKLIAQLAVSLVAGSDFVKGGPKDAMHWKNHFVGSADALIEIIGLAQRIEERAKALEFFPRPYFDFLKNVISGLTRIRDQQIVMINQIQNTVMKTTPVAYSAFAVETLNERLITHLETDVLFLIRMTNRQKLDQVMDLENQLNELTQSLREEFEKIRDKKAPKIPAELKAKIDQIKETMQKIMEQLARQTQALPDEFLNAGAFKSLDLDQFSASLDRIMDLANEGKMDQALEELQKTAEDLQTLANQLDQARSDMDELVDMELMKKLENSMQEILKLEEGQKKLLEQTTDINQKLREAQTKNFESALNNLFEELKKDIHAIQSIFREDDAYLKNHPTMQSMSKLQDEEMAVNQKIQELGQKTVDANQSEDLDKNFKALNQARRELTKLTAEMDALRVDVFLKFLAALPGLQGKYEALDEMADLFDLNEFNNLFKSTYPEVFQWQNSIRTVPNQREDLQDRVGTDLKEVTRLNSEISKKLGSLMRMIRDSDQSLLSEADKAEMEKMAGQEKEMKQSADRLAQEFGQINRQNPMITPELSAKMSRTGRYMQQAESNLSEHRVQRSIDAENRALRELAETREMLQEIKESNQQMAQRSARSTPLKFGTGRARDPRRGGSARMQKEKVNLPSEDQYRVPSEFRDEILKAMKKNTPKSYERLVMEYYKELVK